MKIMNSKAYYLNNFLQRKRVQSQKLPQPLQQRTGYSQHPPSHKIIPHRKVSHAKTEGSAYYSNQKHRKAISTNQITSVSQDILQIQKLQKQVLLKVISKSKMRSTRKSKWTQDHPQTFVIEKHPLRQINSLEIQILKPTDRYFKKLDNIRIAQRLLLVQPSKQIRNDSMKQFYNQQQSYKMNISRMPKSSRRQQHRSRSKLLRRKKWMD